VENQSVNSSLVGPAGLTILKQINDLGSRETISIDDIFRCLSLPEVSITITRATVVALCILAVLIMATLVFIGFLTRALDQYDDGEGR
jgi:hypothetical protein